MKKIYIIIIVIILILVIGYFTNWFGLKKKVEMHNINTRIGKFILPLNIISCPSGCSLSTNTSGASQTTTQGNITYTCRCSDGSTTAPIL